MRQIAAEDERDLCYDDILLEYLESGQLTDEAKRAQVEKAAVFLRLSQG